MFIVVTISNFKKKTLKIKKYLKKKKQSGEVNKT